MLASSTAFLTSPVVTKNAFTLSRLFAKKRSDDDNKPSTSPAKQAALEGVLSRIERNYGRGSIVMLGDKESMVVDFFGSGSMTLGTCSYLRSAVDFYCA